MKIPVSFRTSRAMTDKRILVDSGATDNFIDPRLITRLGLGTRDLERPRKIWNIDGTNNQAGMLTKYVDLSVRTGVKEETIQATTSKPPPKQTNPFLVKKKTTAQDIIRLITDAEDDVKDTIIQEVFMKQDF